MLQRMPNDLLSESNVVAYEHGTISATTVVKLRTIKTPTRVVFTEYDNVAGFATDATDYWTVQLRKGATVIASWSTLTGAQGSLPADTFVNLVPSSTDADSVCAAGDVLSLAFVKTGSPANLTLGRINANVRTV